MVTIRILQATMCLYYCFILLITVAWLAVTASPADRQSGERYFIILYMLLRFKFEKK